MKPKSFFLVFLCFTSISLQGQSDTIKSKNTETRPSYESFTMGMEIRPRTEFRNGFRQLRSDTAYPAILTSQRTRLNMNYKNDKISAAFSIQDVRTWGAADPRSNAGTIQVFEAWVEPYFTPNFSLRVGKQRFMLDNQRLFAQNDWRNNGGTHDAANLRYKSNFFESEMLFAWNQSTEGNYYTNFAPSGFNNYKSLLVNCLKVRSHNGKAAFTGINYYEGFQYGGTSVKQEYQRTEHQNFRYTNGGRLEYFGGALYLTFSGYMQWGHNQVGKQLSAHYIQLEAKYTIRNTELRLGGEFKSGNNLLAKDKWASNYDHSFQYPYGVGHRFNGTMEYLASSYPGSIKDVGLINPYFFIEQKIKDNISISVQNHLFYSQYLGYDTKTKKQAPNNYLGHECDVLCSYCANNTTKVDFGFSVLKASKAMEYISSGSSSYLSYWTYLQLTFSPKLITSKK